MLIDVIEESDASIPSAFRIRVDRCEDIKQVLNVHVL